MEKLSLVALLDEDKEMVLASLARDPSITAAQATLEKAVDRVMYRYAEACGDEAMATSAQHILQAMRNTLPVMDTVGEARTWNRQAQGPKSGLSFGPMSVALLVGGLVLVIAAVLGTLVSGRFSGALAFIKAMLPAVLGSAALFFAGVQAARPRAKKMAPEGTEDVRTEFLVDGGKAWHCLRGAMLQADGQLERVREANAVAKQRASQTAVGGKVEPKALEFFAGVQAARPRDRKRALQGTEDVRTEFLVDGGKAWHCLRGAMLQADGQLERVREANAVAKQRASQTAVGGKVEPKALELFAELLETAYAAEDEGARESAAAIRFYLHSAGVDVVDYTQGRENWFEFLPASREGTMRPALASEGKLIKKGLASKQTAV